MAADWASVVCGIAVAVPAPERATSSNHIKKLEITDMANAKEENYKLQPLWQVLNVVTRPYHKFALFVRPELYDMPDDRHPKDLLAYGDGPPSNAAVSP